MSLHVGHPLVLLLLVGIPAMAAVLGRHNERRDARWVGGLLGRALPLVLVVLALSEPQIDTGTGRSATLAVDRSASIDAHERATESKWTSPAAAAGCAEDCRLVNFASSSSALARGGSTGGQGQSNLAAALSTAVALTPSGGRVVVLSDGGQTQGDLLGTAGEAAHHDVRIDWVPLTDPQQRDASITAIHLPETVRVGDEVPLTLTIHSTVAASATLRIVRDDGAPSSEALKLRAGDNPLLLSYTAVRPGWNSFSATVSLSGDTEHANDTQAAVVDVRPAPRVLVVTDDAGSAVPSLLAAQRLSVSTVSPAALPVDAGSYAPYDAVVLDDVPATTLTVAQVGALDTAVRTDGMGLLALGGPP